MANARYFIGVEWTPKKAFVFGDFFFLRSVTFKCPVAHGTSVCTHHASPFSQAAIAA
jgi:hypothetical protein